MRVGLASDHRGFKLKNHLQNFLKEKSVSTVDYGTYSLEPCDYPDYAFALAEAVRDRKVDRGILICYTGIGSCIAANKVKTVRAGLVGSVVTAKLSRQHNNTNIIVLGAGFLTIAMSKKIVWQWLNTEFEGGRHARRLRKIKNMEEENV